MTGKTKSKTRTASPAPEPPGPPQWVLPAGPITLDLADVSRLTVFETPRDLRRDLHVFVDYVRGRDIKRSVRGNSLPRADVNRLAKLLNDLQLAEETRDFGQVPWIDFIDLLALRLGLVDYDTDGVYAGYSSQEKSYPDNYMTVQESAYARFLALSLAEQERHLLDLLATDRPSDAFSSSANEFYVTGVLGRLDGFTTWGAATGVMPKLQFTPVRRFLLELLARCRVDTWLSTASLVAYLKAEHPYFIIPKGPHVNTWGQPAARYDNFHESIGHPYGQGEHVPEAAPDAFERVEGRYVERFLEGLPLLMGYVDVAYGENPAPGHFPARGVLQAFRVKARLLRSLRGEIGEPAVIVQPNFEIYVQSELYPARTLAPLAPLTDLISSNVVTILKLRRDKVAATLTKDERLDVVALLRKLGARNVPQNVIRELREWGEHSSRFTLYLNHALLEGDEGAPQAEPFVVEQITPTCRLVRSHEQLYGALEHAELMPVLVQHSDEALSPLPEGIRTVFPKRSLQETPQPIAKPALELKRETQIILHFPADDVLERFRKALVDARCSIAVDRERRSITYGQHYAPQVAEVLAGMEAEYRLRVVDLA